MVKFVFFKDTGKKEIKVIKKTKAEAMAARRKAFAKGFGVSRIKRKIR